MKSTKKIKTQKAKNCVVHFYMQMMIHLEEDRSWKQLMKISTQGI